MLSPGLRCKKDRLQKDLWSFDPLTGSACARRESQRITPGSLPSAALTFASSRSQVRVLIIDWNALGGLLKCFAG